MSAVIFALSFVVRFVEYSSNRVFAQLWNLFLRQMRVTSQWNSIKMVRSYSSPKFDFYTARPSGPTGFAFVIASIAVATSSFV